MPHAVRSQVVRRIYAALLEFRAEAALPAARAYTRSWVSASWGGWPAKLAATDGAFAAPDDSVVRWRTLAGDGSRLWELQLDEPFADDATMRQHTLVQVGTDEGRGFAYVQVALVSTQSALTGGVVFENEPPGIVPRLVRHVACSDGGRDLSTSAWLISRSQESAFRRLLNGTHRRLPVVLCVADQVFPRTAADSVAVALAGLGHVAVVPRENLQGFVEKQSLDLPFGASVYLWWAAPHDPQRPRLQWFRGDALAPSAWGVPAWPVVRTVFGSSAFRLGPPGIAGRLESEATRGRIADLERRATSPTADAEMLRAWEADLVSLEHVQREAADLRAENDRLQDEMNALLAAFDIAVADAAKQHETPWAKEALPTPTTLAEAVQIASTICGNLAFLPEAFRSAEAWRFPRPEVALAALHRLDQLALAWREERLGGAFTVAARAAGLPWRPAISRTAQTEYRDDYMRRFGDREVLLGPHLAWGTTPDNALRVYLYLDRATRSVVVGHVGRHLRDTSNPHL